jgi:hypothetical protein
MDRRIIFLLAVIVIIAVSGCKDIEGKKILSDSDLLKYANSSFNKGKMMGKDIILGYHKGTPVRVTFPCSDVCPNYTIRIVRYDVNLSECQEAGGEIKSIAVPFGIGVKLEEFCFPEIIVSNNIYQFR